MRGKPVESAQSFDEADGMQTTPTRPDVIVGLVSPVGVELRDVVSALGSVFDSLGYATHVIRVSDAIQEAFTDLELGSEEGKSRYDRLMTMGTRLRSAANDGAITAMLAVTAMAELRQRNSADSRPIAYVLQSLKHEAEIRLLRQTYGSRFLLVSCTAHEDERKAFLKTALVSEGMHQDEAAVHTEELMLRDQSEYGEHLGQQVRRAFPEADVFIDISRQPVAGGAIYSRQVPRAIELWFGHPFHTPTKAELGMYHAHAASLRSAALGRQVGCAIVDGDGEILATGANEVPKAGGGQYWPDDVGDHRDFRRQQESADEFNQGLLKDLLQKFAAAGWLSEALTGTPQGELVQLALKGPASEAKLLDVLEFARVVHAEMATLMSAARRGVSVREATLYTTTFPCHECAKHIVAAGISKVEYRQPYPKSRVTELFPDSISVDDKSEGKVPVVPFMGIAPRLFPYVFAAGERKDADGAPLPFEPQKATPRLASRDLSAEDVIKKAEDDIGSEISEIWERIRGRDAI